jgi:predicted amidohydrolase YtcJ
MDGIQTAVRRPAGFDQAEKVFLHEAVQAYTASGAAVCGDMNLGSLGEGEHADWQLISLDRWSELL